MDGVYVIVLLGLLTFNGAHSQKINYADDSFDYLATSCRKHAVSLTDFGGVGDGITSNTKAFKAAIDHLSGLGTDGGGLLIVPPGKWLTGSFNLTSYFTLYLHRDAIILGSEEESEWAALPPLPSYGRGRDAPAGRYSSLIFGTNLTDVVITGDNGTINGQGAVWWDKFKKEKLDKTRPYMIELMYSDQIQISNLTLIDSPSWFVHPIYSSNIIIQGLTITAPVDPISPNTDGINPDSCTNVRIEDCYIVSGDDCVAIKSGWDQYGIAVGMPTQHVIIRRLTCISPDSAVVALGSEMSGGTQDIRMEDIIAINSQAGIRIKTAPGRGGFIKDIYLRRMNMETMKYVFWMAGSYGQHADTGYDPKALPVIKDIYFSNSNATNVTMTANLAGIKDDPFTGLCISNVKVTLSPKPKKLQWNCTDIEGYDPKALPVIKDIYFSNSNATNVTMTANLAGIKDDPFTGICISNVKVTLSPKPKKLQWNCTDIEGVTSDVSPEPCALLPDQGLKKTVGCPFPTDRLPIEDVPFKVCRSAHNT